MNDRSMRFYIQTFGCQMNVHDSEKIQAMLAVDGAVPVETPEEADVIVLNTCSVRDKAEQKVFSRIGRLAILKRDNPDLTIVLAGCMARAWGKRIFRRAPSIDLVVGPGTWHRLPEYIRRIRSGAERFVDVEDTTDIHSIPAEQMFLKGRHSAWVTVMEGCNNFCAYCIVPYVRGRERSRPAAEIIREIEYLARKGIREVTLLGQNVNSYSGTPGGFPELLQRINDINELYRIRFTTSHPKDMGASLIQAVADLPKVCEYLHFPAQSGSTKILESMNRNYTREDYMRTVKAIQDTIPGVALSADFIVGYPGETLNDFQLTLSLVETIQYDNIFAFHYSVRQGTRAARTPDDVPYPEKLRRLKILIDLQNTISLTRNKHWIGHTVEVLVDGPPKRGDNLVSGRTRQNRIVNFEGCYPPGTLVHVRIESATANCLYGAVDA